jgi:carboxymethylenebutenolidase
MKTFTRILSRIVIGIALLAVFLVASVLVDNILGANRLDRLANTNIPNGDQPAIRAYVAYPRTEGPHPAVIMFHEFWGLNEDIIGRADELAKEGYIVVAPSMFRGKTSNWIPSAIYQTASTPQSQMFSDLDSVFTWLSSQPDVRPDRIAILGFCFGGGTSLRYSLTNNRLAATVVFYGPPVTDASQLRSLPGPLLGIYAGRDVSISESDIHAFQSALNEAGIENQISIYTDQIHSFVTLDGIRNGGEPLRAWNEALAFLKQTLQAEESSKREVAPARMAESTNWDYLLSIAYEHTMLALSGGHSH